MCGWQLERCSRGILQRTATENKSVTKVIMSDMHRLQTSTGNCGLRKSLPLETGTLTTSDSVMNACEFFSHRKVLQGFAGGHFDVAQIPVGLRLAHIPGIPLLPQIVLCVGQRDVD